MKLRSCWIFSEDEFIHTLNWYRTLLKNPLLPLQQKINCRDVIRWLESVIVKEETQYDCEQ